MRIDELHVNGKEEMWHIFNEFVATFPKIDFVKGIVISRTKLKYSTYHIEIRFRGGPPYSTYVPVYVYAHQDVISPSCVRELRNLVMSYLLVTVTDYEGYARLESDTPDPRHAKIYQRNKELLESLIHRWVVMRDEERKR